MLRKELENERMRNQQLHAQVKTKLGQKCRKETRGANESLLKDALQAIGHSNPRQAQTSFI